MVSRSITTEPTFKFGNPLRMPIGPLLLQGPANPRTFDITDGKIVGILIASSGQTQASPTVDPQIHIVLNWFEELKRLVPTN